MNEKKKTLIENLIVNWRNIARLDENAKFCFYILVHFSISKMVSALNAAINEFWWV